MYTREDYRHGLAILGERLTERQRTILRLQYAAPDRALNVHLFAAQLGYGFQRLNVDYGALGHRLVDAIGLGWPYHQNWWRALSTGASTRQGFVWQMYPALALALEDVGLVTSSEAPEW
jgi:hypothetical protein